METPCLHCQQSSSHINLPLDVKQKHIYDLIQQLSFSVISHIHLFFDHACAVFVFLLYEEVKQEESCREVFYDGEEKQGLL